MGGWLGTIARSAGSVGNDVANARLQNQKDSLALLNAKLQNDELQARIKQMGGPDREALRNQLVVYSANPNATAGERKVYAQLISDLDTGVAPLAVSQNLSKYQLSQGAAEDKPATTLDTAWLQSFRNANDRDPTPDEITKHYVDERAKAGPAPKVAAQENVPYGVERLGQDGKIHIFKPGDAEWTNDDAKILAAAIQARATGENSKLKLQQDRLAEYASIYAQMRGKVQEYSVIDRTTGEPTMANADTINANPGRFMAGSLGQQLKNRASVFDEIDYTSKQFNSALNKLSDDDFKTLPRAQIALALQSRDPSSAISNFMGSEVGTTLSPAQVEYVTGLASMQESAMSLRSIAGMGQGSDTLRNAIVAMLPGPATPSKDYANRQMALFTGELTALRKAVPPSSRLGMPESQNTPAASSMKPAGATHTGIGSVDKKKHWLDDQGKDLGLAE